MYVSGTSEAGRRLRIMSARVCCFRGVGISHGESEPASSSANKAVVVERVIGGSSSNKDDLLLSKLLERKSGDPPGGELPKRDMSISD
jgi:hypothetical protein